MRFYADIEIHSKYARAVSPQMVLENLALWAVKKGLQILGTGDFTHPVWFSDIKTKLEPAEPGLFRLKKQYYDSSQPFDQQKTRFVLSGEISCIYGKNGRTRRVHHLVYAPSIDAAEKINAKLSWVGKLASDGRPIIGIDSKELLKILLTADKNCVLIPAHVWTPWFGVFGSKSGFDSLQECFDELEPEIFAIETGLSSSPDMNWRIPFLDQKAIISSSDSHSLPRIGREATIFDCELSYFEMMNAMKTRDERLQGTVEFFPEEGRYHYDGHAVCQLRMSPEETKKNKGLCPKCGKPVTIGVLARVDDLAGKDRPEGFKPSWAKPYFSMVSFDELIAEALGVGKNTKSVLAQYEEVVKNIGSELFVLLEMKETDLKQNLSPQIAEAISRMRNGRLKIEPGYDGEYGKISIFSEGERESLETQKSLF